MFVVAVCDNLPAHSQAPKSTTTLLSAWTLAMLPRAHAPGQGTAAHHAGYRARWPVRSHPELGINCCYPVPAAGAVISRAAFNSANRHPTTLGTVLTTLIYEGVYPDIGLNNLPIPDPLARQPWGYRIRFRVPTIKRVQSAWLLSKAVHSGATAQPQPMAANSHRDGSAGRTHLSSARSGARAAQSTTNQYKQPKYE